MANFRPNRASIFIASSFTGLGAFVLVAGGQAPAASPSLEIIGGALLFASTIALLVTRRADEYTQGLWNAGASVAFGTMLLAFIGLPFAEGVFDGLSGAERRQDIPATMAPLLAIAAFYVGLFVKRLLGDG